MPPCEAQASSCAARVRMLLRVPSAQSTVGSLDRVRAAVPLLCTRSLPSPRLKRRAAERASSTPAPSRAQRFHPPPGAATVCCSFIACCPL